MASTTPSRVTTRTHFWFRLGVVALALFLFAVALKLASPAPRWKSLMDVLPEADVHAEQAPAGETERVRPPELDGGVAWINSAGPIRLRDLRGKVVLLDFWTLCCINCIHVMPDLAKLEKKYPNELVVIGVHSAKFENEKNTESIRKAVLRYELTHPVVNDANMTIWRNFGVNSWPTLVLIDPEGYVIGGLSGEGHYDVLDKIIGKMIAVHRARKTLKEEPLHFDLARFAERGTGPLYFPGKVLADAAGKRLFIADSTHHRIVITDLGGNKIAVAGTGTIGRTDGGFDQATFNDPQGMALRGDTLFVADRKNDLIRKLDLKTQTVSTVAGTGEQGQDRQRGGAPLKVGLNSPWDLWFHGDDLFIAMAGHHQIWVMDLAKNSLAPYAGNGRENIKDGSLEDANFAQPSGLTGNDKYLFVADSEVSAVRQVPYHGADEVKTVVGQGLFDFGDVDGTGDKVRLQHALGVALHDGKLYVADTYNSKIKILDPEKRTSVTFLGGKASGVGDDGLFNEPGGLSFAGDTLYVADTNAHRIRVVDLKTKAVSTLKLTGVEAPKAVETAEQSKPTFPNPITYKLPAATVGTTGDLTLSVALDIPKGYKLNPQVKMTALLEAVPASKDTWTETRKLSETKPTFQLTVPLAKLAGATALRVSLLYFECGEGGEGVCRIKSRIWDVPLTFDAAAKSNEIVLSATPATVEK